MKTFTKVILTILAIGVVVLIVGLILSKGNFAFGKADVRTLAEKITTEESYSKIDIETYEDIVVFAESEDDLLHIEYYSSEKFEYKFYVKDNVAKFDCTKKGILNFRRTVTKDVVVYVPTNFAGDINIECTSGGFESELQLNCNKVNIEVTSGEANIENLKSTNLNIDLTSGLLTTKNCESAKSDINITSGSLKIEECKFDTAEIIMTSGNTKIENCEINTLNMTNTSGKITATALVSSSIYAKATSGDIKIGVKGLSAEFKLEAHATSGDIRIKSPSESIDFEVDDKIIYGSGSKNINLRTTSGSVTVTFEG